MLAKNPPFRYASFMSEEKSIGCPDALTGPSVRYPLVAKENRVS